MPILTRDARYLVVHDRLWRATNPALTDREREHHTRELMAARRAVRAALRSRDQPAERLARRRVQTAKVALGERGPVWWSDGTPDLNRRMIANTEYHEWWNSIMSIRATMLDLLMTRAAASICPSEVARMVKPKGWRSLMPEVREVARELAGEGLVDVKQRGKRLSPDQEWRGPIRIALSQDAV